MRGHDGESLRDTEDDRREGGPEVPIAQADGDRFFPMNRVAAEDLDVNVELAGVDQAQDCEQPHEHEKPGPPAAQKGSRFVAHRLSSPRRRESCNCPAPPWQGFWPNQPSPESSPPDWRPRSNRTR